MVEQHNVVLIDDVDRISPAVETIHFGVDGKAWQIDLSEEHATQFRRVMEPWISHARTEQDHPRRQPRRKRKKSSRKRNDEVRAWARRNGFEVADSGRIADAVVEAYAAAYDEKTRS